MVTGLGHLQTHSFRILTGDEVEKNGHRILTYVFFEDQNTMVICKDFKYYLQHIKQSISLFGSI